MTDNKHSSQHMIDETDLTRESWKVFQIMAEFVDGFETLADIKPSISMFGSARFGDDHAYYQLAEEIARGLSDEGFSIVSGGGPGSGYGKPHFQRIHKTFRIDVFRVPINGQQGLGGRRGGKHNPRLPFNGSPQSVSRHRRGR